MRGHRLRRRTEIDGSSAAAVLKVGGSERDFQSPPLNSFSIIAVSVDMSEYRRPWRLPNARTTDAERTGLASPSPLAY